MRILIILLIIFISFYCLKYSVFFVVSIIKIREQRMYASISSEPYDFNSIEGLDREFFESLCEKFYRNGFELIGDYQMALKNSSDIIYSRKLVNVKLATLASVRYIVSNSVQHLGNEKVIRRGEKYSFEANTYFQDGTRIIATEKTFPSIFEYSSTIMLNCKEVNEVDGLIDEYMAKLRELLATKGLDNSRMTKDPLTIDIEEAKASYEDQVKHGILVYDSVDECYSFTRKAAMKSCIKMVIHMKYTSKKLRKQNNAFVQQVKIEKVKVG